MAFQPFQNVLATQRVVHFPETLEGDARQRLIAKLTAAIKQQVALANASGGVLRITGDPVVEDDRLLIPHEPGAPLDPNQIEDNATPPDIRSLWWLTLGPLDALKHAAGGGIPHGGIQSGALYRDEAGRIKLGDFGIASAFETVCGIDQRRQLHCDTLTSADDAVISGHWRLLDEDDQRDCGWIAPYFAHELLEGKLRLNPKSDQFALGTLLFLLATGTHPYGAALSDPTMMFYFHLEPYELQDERSDWGEAFERFEQELSGSDDAPILEWARFARTILASDSGQRFANPGEAQKEFAPVLPGGWDQWLQTVHAAEQRLLDGDVPGFLEQIEAMDAGIELPELAAAPFQAWVGQIQASKDEIARGRQREQQLAEANAALDELQLDKARELAQALAEDPEAEPKLAEAAAVLLQQVAEQAEFMESGADALAEAYLKSARECLDGGRLAEARELLDGVLADPGTPPTRATQAREVLTELELIEQRTEQQLESLNAAQEDSREGRYDAARQRLEALLEDQNVPDGLRQQTEQLLDDVRQQQEARAAYVAALDDARNAWERADAETLLRALKQVPEDLTDREIGEIRTDLAERQGHLQAALAERDAALAAVEGGDFQKVVQSLLPLIEDERLPQLLRDECQTLRNDAREQLEELHRARIEAAQQKLGEARTAYNEDQRDACRKLLEEVLGEAALPDDDRRAATDLQQACDRCDAVLEEISNAREHAAAEAFSQGLNILDVLDVDELPASIQQQVETARTEIASAEADHLAARRAALAQRLDAVPEQLRVGALAEAGSELESLAGDAALDAEMQERVAQLQRDLDELRPIEMALDRMERNLGEQATSKEIEAALGQLPETLPEWAENRASVIRQELEARAAAEFRAALQETSKQLEAISKQLHDGEVGPARQGLEALDGAAFDETLTQRRGQLQQLADELQAWLPKIEEPEGLLSAGDIPQAHRAAMKLSEDETLPQPLRGRVEALLEQTKQRILDRRAEIDTELGSIETEMARRGKRARNVVERLDVVQQDAMATKAHKTRASELATAYEELPEPKPTPWGMYIGGGLGAVGLIAIVVMMLKPSSTVPTPDPDPQPPTDPPPVVQDDTPQRINAALGGLRDAFEQLGSQARSEQRPDPGWTLVLTPEDSFPSTLLARAGGESVQLAQVASLDELEALRLPDTVLNRLWPVATPEPDPPTLDERKAQAIARLDAGYRASRGGDDPDGAFGFTGGAGALGQLQLFAAGKTYELGTINEADLDTLAWDPSWLDMVRIPARLTSTLRRLQGEADAAQASAMGDAVRYTLAFDPPDALPTTLRATRASGGTEDLAQVAQLAQLDRLDLTPEMVAVLYPPPPPPSLFELVDETRTAIVGAIDQLTLDADIRDEQATLAGTWQQVTLRPLTLEIAGDATEPDVATATAHFQQQVDQLRALVGRSVWLQMAPDYDARLQPDWSTAKVEQVEPDFGLVVNASLPGGTSFLVNGFVRDGVLQADNQSRTRWTEILQQMQRTDWQQLPQRWRALNLPPDLQMVADPQQEPSDTMPVQVVVGSDPFLEVTAVWSAEALRYEIDIPGARQALATRIADEIEQAAPQMPQKWANMRGQFAEGLQVGAGPWAQSECTAARISSPPSDPIDQAGMTLQVEVAGETIEVACGVVWSAAGVRWTPVTSAQRQQLQQTLQGLRQRPAFVDRQTTAALTRLQAEQVDPGSAQPKVEGQQLVLEIPGGDTYRWDWDNAALTWGQPSKVAAAVPQGGGLDAQLSQLASQGAVTPEALASVLQEIGREKQQRVGGGLTARSASLQDVSERFRRTVTEDVTRDPYPTVFVEYYVGAQSVYGLSWQLSVGGRDRLNGIRDARVWQVMPSSELRGLTSVSSIRQAFSGSLGAKLLGPAIGNRIEAGPRGAYGLAVAPDGPLWLVRWEQVRFGNATVANIRDERTQTPQSIDRLYELIRGELSGRREWLYARSGIWTTPSFGLGPASGRSASLSFADAGPGGQALSVRFRSSRSAGGRMVATIKDPQQPNAPNLANLLKRVSDLGVADLGRFWEIGWDAGTWRPNPVIALAILFSE